MCFSATERIIESALEKKAFTGSAIFVGRGNQLLFQQTYGRCCIEEQAQPVQEQTQFDLASITKPLVIGMLCLQALEKGDLCLWDKLATFMDTPPDKKNITIKHLLTHSAGFTTGVHMWKHITAPAESTRFLLQTPLAFEPGKQVRYCCVGYILLGQLLEKLYHMPLQDLAMQSVFLPLGMKDTTYLPKGSNIVATEKQKDERCLSGVVHDENARFLGGVAGNAGVFSTIGDMAKFVRMLANEGRLPDGTRYLSANTLRVAMQNHTIGLEQGRGLGFYLPYYDNSYIGDLFPKESIGHTGFTGTSFTLDPITGIFLIFLCNRVCPTRDNLTIHRLRRLLHNTVYATVDC